jgi:hypothetical protein
MRRSSGRSMDSVIHEIAWLLSTRYLVSDARSHPCAIRTYNAPKILFSATLGEQPEVEVALI